MLVQRSTSNYGSCTCEKLLKAIKRLQARKVRLKETNESKLTCLLSLKNTRRKMSRVNADLHESGINCKVSNVRSPRQRYKVTVGQWLVGRAG